LRSRSCSTRAGGRFSRRTFEPASIMSSSSRSCSRPMTRLDHHARARPRDRGGSLPAARSAHFVGISRPSSEP
jgi:hypothetical protein